MPSPKMLNKKIKIRRTLKKGFCFFVFLFFCFLGRFDGFSVACEGEDKFAVACEGKLIFLANL